ncbi:MAG: RNA polymerase sigma factor [Planctomycetes bacterium]|nr:RNA polymerase sigma factor [Planctomycetota bacterium]
MTLDFQDLLTQARAGSNDAMAALLQEIGPRVRSRIRPLIGTQFRSLIDEDDVMQEAYSEAFLQIGSFASENSFENWLYRIAKNNLLDAIRGLQAVRRSGVNGRAIHNNHSDAAGHDFLALLADSATPPSGHAVRNEMRIAVTEAINQLPDVYRRVVELYDMEGTPAAEVARILQCSEGAVYMRRARAHRHLRRIFE